MHRANWTGLFLMAMGSAGVAHAEPARLAVEAPDEAGVHVDGELVALTPLAEPLELPPGAHVVAITLDGHEAQAQSVELEAGETTTVVADLEVTGQRIGASLLLGAGAAGIAAGVVLGVLAVVEHREAQDLYEGVGRTGVDPSTRTAYDDAIAARDDFRLGSGVAAGVGLGLFLVGGALFVLDRSEPPEVAVAPVIAPDRAGITLRLGF